MSMNTEYYTLKLLSDEAVRQNKNAIKSSLWLKPVDLREGVMGDHLIDFYAKVF